MAKTFGDLQQARDVQTKDGRTDILSVRRAVKNHFQRYRSPLTVSGCMLLRMSNMPCSKERDRCLLLTSDVELLRRH